MTCSTVREGLDYLVEYDISAITLDYQLDGFGSVEIGEKIKSLYPQIPFFFFTSDAQSKSREKAMQGGAQGYFFLPDDISNIVPKVGRFLESAY